jgi:hypothetical protein
MTLNDDLFFACAQGLAGRILREPSGSTADLLRYGWRVCLAREPTAEELTRLERLYATQLELLRADPAAAQAIAGKHLEAAGTDAASVAAWIGISRALLNLDEFLNRE